MTPPVRSVNSQGDAPSDQVPLLQPSRGRDARSLSSAAISSGMPSSRGHASYTTTNPAPGSFSSQLRPTQSHPDARIRPDFDTHAIIVEDDTSSTSEQRQASLQDQIDKETKIKVGSENLLEALNVKNAKNARQQRDEVERQLSISNNKLAQLKSSLAAEIQRQKEIKSPPVEAPSTLSYMFQRVMTRSPSRHSKREEEQEEEAESPTFVLAEILQALEVSGMQPEYYVTKANLLVDLFKRHATLKYDLAWSIFGLRMQTLLLSDNREVVAAGYRVLRHSITDRKSLQIIRGLHTDYVVIVSLVKEGKASVEREQALKFVRAFLDVKGGPEEISRAVARVLVSVAEHTDDRLRNIAMLTLAELLVRKPALIVAAGGMGTLADVLGEGNYLAAKSISRSFLYLLDTPRRRNYLKSGHELHAPFAAFTDAGSGHGQTHEEKKLKQSADVIASLIRSWPGLCALCMDDFRAIRSLILSLQIDAVHVRTIILELLSDILMIKAPSWSSSFLAGRRLTTYGRVLNLKNEPNKADPKSSENDTNKWNLLEHYVSVVLAVFLHAGLVPALLQAEAEPLTLALKRKTTLLLGEILKMANELLPPSWSAQLQVLPQLLRLATNWGQEDRFVAIGTIYQVDSVNRTLYRSGPTSIHASKLSTSADTTTPVRQADSKVQAAMQMDEAQFRNLMLETQVLNTVNYTKWRWDLIQIIIDGPLLNVKRLDEAMKATKFLHRLLGFYRPFKFRFSEIKNTKPNQRYVRAGRALMHSLLQSPEGIRYLGDSKLIRQIAECLSHFDRMSGLTSESPIFQVESMNEKLTGGYFALLGELSKDSKGVQILERWRIFNMFYHIIELHDRDDLIRVLLSNMDYTLDGHLRIIISKAMTSCSKEIRIFSTRLLRKYATRPMQAAESVIGIGVAEWAIKLLVTQLYDPEVEVCEVAIKILEEACNQKESLEYVVKCRPALDHLGEIGAPLLLRFLSTSVGYHYLDELDYITREMDDWFLGRNDSYVALVEASMDRAIAELTERPQQPQLPHEEVPEHTDYGVVPPHFYRELTRTKEGCKLLQQKGHFDDFVDTIRDSAMEDDDDEIILKVKGCLWAVGNVGSMELGAPFLEKSDVVKWIVKIAETSKVMSLRGTAFYVLGLISRSLHGQEILLENGWDGVVNDNGEGLGFCLPLDFKKLFAITPWVETPNEMRWKRTTEVRIAVTDTDPLNARILKLITDLGNTVLAKKSATDLQAIKAKKAPGLAKPAIFHKAMQVLEAHHFRLPVCRFVLDLFDRSVLRQIVLEEEEEASSEEEESSEQESSEDADAEGQDTDSDDSNESESETTGPLGTNGVPKYTRDKSA